MPVLAIATAKQLTHIDGYELAKEALYLRESKRMSHKTNRPLMSSILDRIVADKRTEVRTSKTTDSV